VSASAGVGYMIWIVPKPTDTPSDNSTGAVMTELERLGAACAILDPGSGRGMERPAVDDIIWICGMEQDGRQFEVLNALSQENRVINTPESIALCANKARTTEILSRHGITTPETLFTTSREEGADFIERHGKVVYKPLYGYGGEGIRLITGMDEAGAPPYYLQEYIPNDRDFRVFVIAGEAIGAITRRSQSLTHNIHQGGAGKAIDIPDDMREIAEAAASPIGTDYCGVDLLRDRGGYTVLEVNGTPNWHCMSAPIPKLLAAYLIQVMQEP